VLARDIRVINRAEALGSQRVTGFVPAQAFLLGPRMPHARRYLIEIKDAEADAVVICRAADWTDKEKHAAVVSVMRLAELPDILITKSPPCEQPLLREPAATTSLYDSTSEQSKCLKI
jgi:hypothetical protein